MLDHARVSNCCFFAIVSTHRCAFEISAWKVVSSSGEVGGGWSGKNKNGSCQKREKQREKFDMLKCDPAATAAIISSRFKSLSDYEMAPKSVLL
jgi:hypothetical protein